MEEEAKKISDNKETNNDRSSSSVLNKHKRADAKGYVDPSTKKKKEKFEN